MEENNSDKYKQTMRKMLYIGRLHRCVFERNISSLGIHHSQHHMLMYIAREGEVDSQKQIAEKFGISPAATARTLKTLEAEGYITRSSSGGDGRFNKIVITEKGRDIFERSHIMFNETDVSVFADFSEEDLTKFNEYLDLMKSRLIEKSKENNCSGENK